jgi:hypothetical protein
LCGDLGGAFGRFCFHYQRMWAPSRERDSCATTEFPGACEPRRLVLLGAREESHA